MYTIALDLCTNFSFLTILSVIINIFNIFCVVLPVLMVVLIIIDFSKGIISSDEDVIKKAISKSVVRVIACVIVFVLPTIGRLFVTFLNNQVNANLDMASCIANVDNIDYFKNLDNLAKEQAKEEAKERAAGKLKAFLNEIKHGYNFVSLPEGSFIGKTYSLNDEELNYITRVCQCESGRNVEVYANFIANRYELYGNSYSSLYSYLKNSKWWACANNEELLDKNAPKVKDNAKSKVKSVLVLGNRTLPLYIDEHDCINCTTKTCENGNRGDICSVEYRGMIISEMELIQARSNLVYVQNQSIINNRYGGKYTFYGFACEKCDPFGYTERAISKYNSLNNS